MSQAKAKVKTKAKAASPAGKARPAATAAKAMPKKTSAKRVAKKAAPKQSGQPASDPGAWRAETLARMRSLILEAEPEMIEERKWKKPSNGMMGVPVWSRYGIVCTGEVYKNAVKLTFAQGAKVPDPARLFNSSLEGGTRRAIDISEGGKIDARAFKALVKAAVAHNASAKKR